MAGPEYNLIKTYINNLDIPYDKKIELLATQPKTLADISLWLSKNISQDASKGDSVSESNPFSQSSQVTTSNPQDIQVFSSSTPVSNSGATSVAPSGLVDTDDASWGLGIERTPSKENIATQREEFSGTQIRDMWEWNPDDIETEAVEENPVLTEAQNAYGVFSQNESITVKLNENKNKVGGSTTTVRLPKDENPSEGEFPKTLIMSLPAEYGKNATMTLNLVNDEVGIYETTAHDRQFKLSIAEDGSVSLDAVASSELDALLKQHLAENQKALEEKATKSLKSHKSLSWKEDKFNTATELAKDYYQKIGVKNPTKAQIDAFINDFKVNNPNVDPSDIKGKRIICRVPESTYKRVNNRNNVASSMRYELENARQMLDSQLSQERGFHALYKAMTKYPVNSSPSAGVPLMNQSEGVDLEANVKKDIAEYEKQVKRLEKCKTQKELEETFFDIYQVPYDAKKIENYKKYQDKLSYVEASKALENSFSEDMDWLLSGKCENAIKNNPGYISNDNYENYANKLAEYVGGGDVQKGRQLISEKIQQYCGKNEQNMTPAEKLTAITKYSKFIQGEFHKNTVKESGGIEYDQFKNNMQRAYNSAYGNKNNVAERVTAYSNTVNTGAMVSKTAVILGAAVATGGVASSVAGASAVIGAETALISGADKSFDGHGQLRAMTEDEVIEVLEEAGVAAAFTAAGGTVGELLSKSGLNQLAQQGVGLTADVGMAAGYEKATTGTISIGGVLFNTVFSAAGRLVSIKAAAKNTTKEQPIKLKSQVVDRSTIESGLRQEIDEYCAIISNKSSTVEEIKDAVKGLRKNGYKYENNELVPLLDNNDVHSVALGIRDKAEPFRSSANSFIDRIAEASGASKSYRIKGDFGINSLEGKIKKEACAPHQDPLLDAVNNVDPESAMSRVFDLYGARFKAKDQAGIDKIYQELYSAIENGEFIPDFITNYRGAGGKAYFSKEQMLELKALCDKMGYNNVKFPSLTESYAQPDGSIIYTDGYTSAHVNGRIKVTDAQGNTNYMPTEIQIRTENIEEVLNAAHIPYDVVENPNKDILASMTPEQRKLAEPLVEKFIAMRGKDNPLYIKYKEYQTDYINAAKENNEVLPKVQDYGLPEEVSIENILKLESALNANSKPTINTPHIDYAINLQQRGILSNDKLKPIEIRQEVEMLCSNANTAEETAAILAKIEGLGNCPISSELKAIVEQRNAVINTKVLPEGVKPEVMQWETLTQKERDILLQYDIKPVVKENGKIEYPSPTKIHGILRKPLTTHDTPAIIEERFRAASSGSYTYDAKNILPEISQISTDILNQAATVPKERKLVIITGRCGAGKSTIVKEKGMRGQYMEMDADELIKPRLPGFKEKGATYVHKASVQLNKQTIFELMEDGTNLIVPTTGWKKYVTEIIDRAKANGYTIELIHSNVTAENSCQRAISRYIKGEELPDGTRMHRIVNPYAIEDGVYVDDVINNFRNNPNLRKITVYDNNGEKVKFVEEIVNK